MAKIAPGLVEGEVFDGLEKGFDWRLWNGSPCGYEGVLDDRFGLLEMFRNRWQKNRDPNAGDQVMQSYVELVGNYLGKATNPAELMADLEQATWWD